jgi:hypothetical protein
MLRAALCAFFLLLGNILFSQDFKASMKLPSGYESGKEFTVEVVVTKGGLNGFMKFYQEVPAGSSASSLEVRGGSFTFADNGVKIVWISPPAEPEFTISYKLTINASGPQTIGGKFSYIKENERKTFDIPVVQLGEGKAKQAEPADAGEPKKEIKKSQPKIDPRKEEPVVALPTTKKEEKVVSEAPPQARIPVTAAAGAGKTYRVQIGAFAAKPKKIEGVSDISTVVLENGITKYFSGNFSTYEAAAKRKTELIAKGFQGAFIVAFENGKIVK